MNRSLGSRGAHPWTQAPHRSHLESQILVRKRKMILDPGLNKEGPQFKGSPFSHFLKLLLLYGCGCGYLHMPAPFQATEGIRSTGTGLPGICESSDVGGCWESKVGPLEE